MDAQIIKRLETHIKYAGLSNGTCIVNVTDIQRLIQEYKNQEKIINETAREKDYYKKKYEEFIEFSKRTKDCNEEFEL